MLLQPPSFCNLSIKFFFHFFALALEEKLFVVVKLFGEKASSMTSLLELLCFLFIKHYKIIIMTNKQSHLSHFKFPFFHFIYY